MKINRNKLTASLMAVVMLLSLVTVGATAESRKLGDVNRDGDVDALDAAEILRFDAGVSDLDSEQLLLADTNRDGGVDSIDSAYILQHDAGIKPIEQPIEDSSEDLSEETSEANSSEAESSEEASEEVSGETSEEVNEEPEPEYWVPTEEDIEFICDEFIRLLNIERAKLGAQPLETAPIAHEMAMVRAEELKTLFAHERPGGRQIATIYIDYEYNPNREGVLIYDNGEWCRSYAPDSCGENILKSSGDGYERYLENDDIKEFLTIEATGWVNNFSISPGHWRDLTNPEYSGVGVGVGVEAEDGLDIIFHICVMTMDKLHG